uniref:Uncharacterized protein n=1 Tax=Candidatus Kentrum eta TaxID=2126337 RepID=A0A450UDL5_9GAMM|nr:MAG: hypothetical protein BECKH772A_GA0070896_1000919 [Candidatus Kentron sp. H]VFJ90575.1 MAG: hypothetical protein BECKH772B_GA0070898_1001019 [Candidatus Kentron sp. H]VFJ96716.1 MAG: hypothetical protein BECKH772C_GA0070978_1000819 [Candidatus Kentron sp. H]
MQTTVNLPEEPIAGLKYTTEPPHLSRAGLIRCPITEYPARHRPAQDDEAFGIWRKHKRDAITWQEQMRAEWDT